MSKSLSGPRPGSLRRVPAAGTVGTVALALVLGGALAGVPAAADEMFGSDVSATADVTLTHGLSFRAAARDDSLTGANSDDGDRNYDRGLISNTSSVTAEVEIDGGAVGLFARTHGFIDFENQNGERARTPLSEEAKEVAGRDFEILDLYVSAALDPGDIPLDLRVGNQVLNWGESTFIPNGVNVVNPVDVSRLRTPGAELRNAFVPVPIVSASAEPVANLSVEGFWQFGWDKTEIDPSGTYFSTNDYVGAGGRYAFLTDPRLGDVTDEGRGFMGLERAINGDLIATRAAASAAVAADPTSPVAQAAFALSPRCDHPSTPGALTADCQLAFDPYFLGIERTGDREPDDGGQWGLALRYFSEELNDTEFGFYVANVHSRLPFVTGRVGTQADLLRSAGVAGAVSAPDSNTVKAVTGATTDAVTAAFAAQIRSGIPPQTPPELIPGIVRTELMARQQAIQTEVRSRVQPQVQQLATGLAIDRFAKSARYFVEYPEDLRTFGVSFNTALGNSGWALQGEYSFRPDAPLQREEASLFGEALEPIVCVLERQATGEALQQSLAQCPTAVLGNVLDAYAERDVSQAQLTATRIFGPGLGADSIGFIAEAALMLVHDMPSQATMPLDTAGAGDDKADATSFGYRGAVWMDFNNAIGAVRLSPFLQFQHDVSGSSPAPSGPFVEGRNVITIGLGASYLDRWQAEVSYTAHAGSANSLSDRDFVAMSLSYSF